VNENRDKDSRMTPSRFRLQHASAHVLPDEIMEAILPLIHHLARQAVDLQILSVNFGEDDEDEN
jgi:hypothetical protein